MLASTQRAIFGFALSPDGSELAYGGVSFHPLFKLADTPAIQIHQRSA